METAVLAVLVDHQSSLMVQKTLCGPWSLFPQHGEESLTEVKWASDLSVFEYWQNRQYCYCCRNMNLQWEEVLYLLHVLVGCWVLPALVGDRWHVSRRLERVREAWSRRKTSRHLAPLNVQKVVVRVMPLVARLERWQPHPPAGAAEMVQRDEAVVVMTM